MGVVCEILVKKPNKLGIHRAGSPVEGTVKYVISKAELYQNITLSLIGKGKVLWSSSTFRVRTQYTGKEKYEAQYQSLLDINGEKSVLVQEGTYSHDFHFVLLQDLPSSVRDGTCTITYNLIMEFERNSYFSRNQKFCAEIFVCSDYKPYSLKPILYGLQKVLFKPFSLKAHLVSLKAGVKSTLISPGDKIALFISVYNDTNVDIMAVKTELSMCTRYTADSGVKRKCKKTFKKSTQQSTSIKPNDFAEFNVMVTTLTDLRSIQHSYIMKRVFAIKVTVIMPAPHRSAFIEIPIVLGENTEVTDECIEDVISPEDWQLMVEDTKIMKM